jgi:hypothetical protein
LKDPFLEDLWRRSAGLPEKYSTDIMDISSLKRTEWSTRFEKAMRNRLVMGAFRYGLLYSPEKLAWDRIKRAIYELEQYLEDGNDERLVDIANMMMLEFEEGNHPKKHFRAGDDGVHTVLK